MSVVRQYLKDIYREPAHEGRLDFLRLDMNENPEGLPQEFFDRVMGSITPEMLAAYPEVAPLKRTLSTYLGISEDHLVITNGSDDAIYTIFDVFGEPGKEIVSVYPTFAMYMVNAKVFAMKHIAIEYADDLSMDINKILDAINVNTRIVAMLNPNNPIGNIYTEAEMRSVIEKAAKFDAVVVIDEAYHYFYDKTFIDLVKEYENVILTRTFSKLSSIAGLRIGYAVSSPDNVALMQTVKPTYNVNQIAIIFARAILEEKGLLERLIKIEQEGRQWIIGKVSESNRPYYAQNGNYVFIHCNTGRDAVFTKLHDGGILVKKYDYPALKDYIRISTGSIDTMTRFWRVFEKVDA